MYKYYLFDIDRTLWAFDSNAKRSIFKLIDIYRLEELFDFKGKETFFSRYEVHNHKLWAQYEAGEIPKELLRTARFYNVFEEYLQKSKESGVELEPHSWSKEKLQEFATKISLEYLEYMVDETELEPNSLKVLETLKSRGAKIAVISNGFKEVQYRKLRNSNILHFMDAIIISEEVGVHKPTPIIFQKALEQLCTKEYYLVNRAKIRREALMIGDDFPNDIEGAQVFGIDQFYYNPYHKPCDGGPTYEGDNLIAILDL